MAYKTKNNTPAGAKVADGSERTLQLEDPVPFLGAVSGETYTVKINVDDPAPGFLDSKIDHSTIVVTGGNCLSANIPAPTYTVKANAGDTSPGYLVDKIDNTTITLNGSNQLVAGPRPMLVKTTDFDLNATCLNQTVKVDSQTDITATLVAANTVPSGSWICVINTNPGVLTISGYIGDRYNQKLGMNNTVTFMSTGGSWRWVDSTNVVPKPTHTLTGSATLSKNSLNRTVVFNSATGGTVFLPAASEVVDGTFVNFVNIGVGSLVLDGVTTNAEDWWLSTYDYCSVVSNASHWYRNG